MLMPTVIKKNHPNLVLLTEENMKQGDHPNAILMLQSDKEGMLHVSNPNPTTIMLGVLAKKIFLLPTNVLVNETRKWMADHPGATDDAKMRLGIELALICSPKLTPPEEDYTRHMAAACINDTTLLHEVMGSVDHGQMSQDLVNDIMKAHANLKAQTEVIKGN